MLQHRANVLSWIWETLDEEKAHVTNAWLKTITPGWWFIGYWIHLERPPKALRGIQGLWSPFLMFVASLRLWRGSWNQSLTLNHHSTQCHWPSTPDEWDWFVRSCIPDMERLNVVYFIPCANCHRRPVQRAEAEVSALAEHVWKLDYRVDWGTCSHFELQLQPTWAAHAP